MWTDEARAAAVATRANSGASKMPHQQFGIASGAQFSGKALGNNQPKSGGAKAVSDLRAALALGQGHPKSRMW